MSNIWPLDKSVNRSLGAQIKNAIRAAKLPEGTRVFNIIIGD